MKAQMIFPNLYRVVEKEHLRAGLVGDGHDIWHALRVAQCAIEIAETPEIGRLAFVAGLCHNADRLIEKGGYPPTQVSQLVKSWLQQEPLLQVSEYPVIVEAVLLHSDLNDAQVDKPVAITLADADRVVNLEADVVIRGGQMYHNLPAVDPVYWLSNPKTTFKAPGSVIRTIADTLDWVQEGGPVCLRLPKAWEKAKPRAEFLLLYLKTVYEHLEESGLLP